MVSDIPHSKMTTHINIHRHTCTYCIYVYIQNTNDLYCMVSIYTHTCILCYIMLYSQHVSRCATPPLQVKPICTAYSAGRTAQRHAVARSQSRSGVDLDHSGPPTSWRAWANPHRKQPHKLGAGAAGRSRSCCKSLETRNFGFIRDIYIYINVCVYR